MNNGVSLERARRAKSKALEVVGPLVGEVAVGIKRLSSAGFGLKVNLTTPPAEGIVLPSQIDGVPIAFDVVGTIKKQS